MYTIMDYLEWRGDLSIHQSAFNEVDAAILARFSYEPFEEIVSENFRSFKSVKQVCEELLNSPDLNDGVLDYKLDFEFIRAMGASKRFSEMRISGFVNDTDVERQIQFSACLFDIDGEQNYFIAFRGTDNTIIGWKEDFNMGFEFPVPAQKKARAYLENAVSSFKDGTFMVGGHSKGGNLSIYSATFCDDKFNAPITDIYNFDGPGFTESIMQTDEFKRIEDQIHTFVPEFSVVGMLLEHLEDYSVVHSSATGIMEHEILTWEVGPLGFVHKEEVNSGSRFVDRTLKDWLSGLDNEQREQFVDTIFNLMMCDNAQTLVEFNQNRRETINAMIRTYNNLDAETKVGFKSTAKKLFASAKAVFSENKARGEAVDEHQ